MREDYLLSSIGTKHSSGRCSRSVPSPEDYILSSIGTKHSGGRCSRSVPSPEDYLLSSVGTKHSGGRCSRSVPSPEAFGTGLRERDVRIGVGWTWHRVLFDGETAYYLC